MSQNLELKFIEKSKKKASSDFSKVELDSAERWKKMIYFLLNISAEDQSANSTYSDLLTYAQYMEVDEFGAIALTSEGFHFIL